MTPEGAERAPKVSQREPKGRPREPKGSQREPKGRQREPKGSQWESKGCQRWAKGRPKCIQNSMFGKGREKGSQKGHPGTIRTSIFGPFSIKNVIKNRCKNRCQKNMEFDGKSIQKWNQILHKFENNFHEKTSFRKRVHVRKPYESSSRIRVGEGSPENEKIEN